MCVFSFQARQHRLKIGERADNVVSLRFSRAVEVEREHPRFSGRLTVERNAVPDVDDSPRVHSDDGAYAAVETRILHSSEVGGG